MKSGTIVKNRINLNELAYDAAIFIFPLILEHFYGRLITFQPLGLPFVQLFLAGAIYFLPLLVGKMYTVDFGDSSKWVRKCVLIILFATLFFAYGNLLKLVLPAIDHAGSYGKFIMVAATLFLIMGPIAGLAFTGKNAPRVEGASTQMILFLMTIGMLPLFFMFMAGEELFGNTGILLSLLIIMGLVVGDVIFIILLYVGYSKCKKMLIRAGVYDTIMFILRLLAPFCVSFLLVFFYINSDRLFMSGMGTGRVGSVLLVIFLYLASGVLPLRIMMMLTPPVRPINIVIGIVSAVSMVLVVALK
jgi:hypothetical protein